MGKHIPITLGEKFGYLTSTGNTRQDTGFSRPTYFAECTCECGKTLYASYNSLRCGRKRSCGCLSATLVLLSNVRTGKRKYSQIKHGTTSGFVTALEQPFPLPGNNNQLIWYVLCECRCGQIKTVDVSNFFKGCSCGCVRRATDASRMRKHGGKSDPDMRRLYHVWGNMRQRCQKVHDAAYYRYGGRGICVCKDWDKSFIPFQQWSLANGYRVGLTLDRINNDGDYSPMNCRWVTQKVNNRNTSSNVVVTAFGQTKSVAEWADDRLCVVGYATLLRRLRAYEWPAERAITTPSRCIHSPRPRRR